MTLLDIDGVFLVCGSPTTAPHLVPLFRRRDRQNQAGAVGTWTSSSVSGR